MPRSCAQSDGLGEGARRDVQRDRRAHELDRYGGENADRCGTLLCVGRCMRRQARAFGRMLEHRAGPNRLMSFFAGAFLEFRVASVMEVVSECHHQALLGPA